MSYPDVRVYVDFATDAVGDAQVWTDITDYVLDLSTEWGRQSLVDEFQPGQGRATLVNTDGRFDPANTGSPYYPGIYPRRRVKVEAALDEEVIDDEFPGTTLNPAWSTFGGTVTVSSGQLSISAPTATGATRGVTYGLAVPFYGASMTSRFSMAGSWNTIDATYYPVYWQMDAGNTEAASFGVTGTGNLVLYRRQGGVTTQLTSFVYSSVNHAWVRIRRVGSTTWWERSSDGATWVALWADDIAWSSPLTATPRMWIQRGTGTGTTGVLNLLRTIVAYDQVHPVSYGWVDGWPQRQEHRRWGDVEITWTDFLGMASRAALPVSVWDYRVEQLAPYAWYKLDDTTPALTDSSGNQRHGRWRVVEGYNDAHTPGHPDIPASVLQDGSSDRLIPATDREGKSWARMMAELGQPLGGTPDFATVRHPVALTGVQAQTFQTPGSWTVEFWVLARQAFPVDVTGGASATTPIEQPVVSFGQWGEPAGHLVYGIDEQGRLYVAAYSSAGTWGGFTFATSMLDGLSHHVAFVAFASGGSQMITGYLDGVGLATVDMGVLAGAWNREIAVGYASPDDGVTSFIPEGETILQSTLSDVVIYDRALTSTEVRTNHAAGRYGSLDPATGQLIAGEAIDQALSMIGWEGVATSITPGTALIDPGVIGERSAIDYCRDAATAEQGPLYQARDGKLTFLARDWTTGVDRAREAHWSVTDGTGSAISGYSELDFDWDDAQIVNEVVVRWTGGEEKASDTGSQARYGPLRKNISTNLALATDARALADHQVWQWKAPKRLVRRPLVVEPVTATDWAFVLGVDFGSRVTVTRTTPDGRTLTDDYWVQAVRHSVEPGQGAWVTELQLDPADDPARAFTLDLSTLDGADVLTY